MLHIKSVTVVNHHVCNINSLEVVMIFSFPIVTKFNADMNPHALNVRLDFRVERVVLRIRVLGNEGIDFLAEPLDAVRRGHTQVARLSIIGLHLRV